MNKFQNQVTLLYSFCLNSKIIVNFALDNLCDRVIYQVGDYILIQF